MLFSTPILHLVDLANCTGLQKPIRLLSSYEDRRTWLARKMDVMKIGPATFSYQIDVLGQGTRRACARAWRFAYGVPEATHKRNMSGHPTNNKKTRHVCIPTGSCFFYYMVNCVR